MDSDSSNAIPYFFNDTITRSRGNIVEPDTTVAVADHDLRVAAGIADVLRFAADHDIGGLRAPQAAAVRALGAVGADFAHVNIFEDPELREALKQYSNWPTYPQLYVNGELVGGCDIVTEMHEKGELKSLIENAVPADEK